ncbi:PHP domain-containing protein [Oceanobacillus profundus]|uniref:PHP domain-containing protein n=1 Tax=Oceanobacillus profundus TaxID=372463 RepID=A0A417YGH5_9BACI|nr:PHP domain-containing protein [Oceanobacillus profundus]RHW31846.1 PHP domain-containing protein [Oceanobacillus profundus]
MGAITDNIVHIHVHSEDSKLDGLPTINDLIKKAKEIGSPALGLTDHGVMGGIASFIQECKNQGIKPLPGIEAYLVKNRHLHGPELENIRLYLGDKYKIVDKKGKFTKKPFNEFIKKIKKDIRCFEEEAEELLKGYLMNDEMDLFDLLDGSVDLNQSTESKIAEFKADILKYLDYASNDHLLLLAMNDQGLKDLYKISSDAHINGFYSDPRTDLKFIQQNNLGENIIATSACLGSTLARYAMNGRMKEAVQFIEECKKTFHAFYLEKQAVVSRDQVEYNKLIDELAEKTNTPKVITTDVHFANKEDHELHDILVAGSMKKCVLDEDRYIYSEDHYMKTVEEIRKNFRDEEAIANTLRIADMVDVSLPTEPLFPRFPVEDGDSVEEVLRKKSWEALFQYCLKNPDIDFNKYANQLNYELDVICSEGFADYFLITEDFINAAQAEHYLVGPGRGSAAGSLVCFVLNITTVDPLQNGLLFERFLNPERAGYPD